MACIEHYIKDAENVFEEIQIREKSTQKNAYLEYKAARTIQRWFRGYITRKHLENLNHCATTIQKNWRGYVDRKMYLKMLQKAVHKMYWEYYNNMATKIQKVWRGHYVRSKIFSYYKLKQYIKDILQKNKEIHQQAKEHQAQAQQEMQRRMQEECKEWLQFLSFKIHHLIRTHQIEGVFSKHGTLQYSSIEKHLKNLKFTDYMTAKHRNGNLQQQSKPPQNYLFKGRMRECEEVWLHRNDPGVLGLATGEYGLDKKQQAQDASSYPLKKPMVFGPVRYNDTEARLNKNVYQCPPLHRSVK